MAKAGEEWARRILEKELKGKVSLNDDNSAPGMYDLRVGPADVPEIAVECVEAIDPIWIETWMVGPARGPLELALTGDWSIELTPGARIDALRQRVEPLLRELEERGLYDVPVNYFLKRYDAAVFHQLESLNITYASCFRVSGTGKVHLDMTGIGGAVDSTGGALPGWVGEFLRDSSRRDVLSKLERSRAPERHAFLLVSFAGAPWLVESYLTTGLDQLPSEAPDLPPTVTGVWIASQFGRRGLRWDSGAWRVFEARGDGID